MAAVKRKYGHVLREELEGLFSLLIGGEAGEMEYSWDRSVPKRDLGVEEEWSK